MDAEGARATTSAPRIDEEGRLRSKALFGNRDTLEVLAAIAETEDGIVCAADLERAIHLPNNRIRTQLLALTKAGLLDAVPQGRDRVRWYRRIESAIWPAAVKLCEEWGPSSTLR